METMHDARFYEPLPGGEVLCRFCPAHIAAVGQAIHPDVPAPECGQLLYENLCQSCHTSIVHIRVGADLIRLKDIRKLGTFDGVFITGFVAVLLA